MYCAAGATKGYVKWLHLLFQNRNYIENSFDICTTKFKSDIFALLYSWSVNPIDVNTLLSRGRPQAEAGNALSI